MMPRPFPLRHALLLSLLLGGIPARAPAQQAPTPAPPPAEVAPSYLIEAIRITGNEKTHDSVIRRALGVKVGERLSAASPRFEVTRYRVLSLGYFSEVRLRLEKGSARGKAVLVVHVEERGTIILTELFLGTSEATSAWGGLGLAEQNFLGRGFSVEGAFVLGADPEVTRGELQQSYRLRVRTAQISGANLSLSSSFRFLDGSEFFRRSGPDSSSLPSDFLSIRYRRIGGSLGMGFNLLRFTRMYITYRGEAIEADIPEGAVRQRPDGDREPIRFGIHNDSSILSLGGITLERDTRTDPVLPRDGSLLSVSGEFSHRLLGSSYDYAKLSVSYQVYYALKWGHVLSGQLMGGILFGQAPFFEKFFIGDYNDLLASRALGLNFSTLPSRDVFGTNIDDKRFEEIAVRAAVEYVIPWFRGGEHFYGGDFFINLGLISLTSREALRMRDQPLSESIPVDLTMDAGLRLDTRIGVFRLSIGNALARIPF